MKIGVIFVLLTLLFGYGLGVFFGAKEDNIKAYLKAEAQPHFATHYQSDQAKMDKVTTKSWSYIKRAHFHANGIATTALALIVAMALLPGSALLRKISAFALGFGGLAYSFFWLIAGCRSPGLGSNGAAKATLTWLAAPSAGLILAGVLLSSYVIVKGLLTKED